MSLAPNPNIDKFLVSAYQNPHTGKLYPINDPKSFLKDLKSSTAHHEREQLRAELMAKRKDIWSELRNTVRSEKDIVSLSKAACSKEMEDLYLTTHSPRTASSDFWSLPIRQTRVEHMSISHYAPLGMQTNWCLKDETKPGHKIALRIKSERNLNSSMYGYSTYDSGFRVCNGEMYLFADDWPFVQRLALVHFLEKTLTDADGRHPVKTFLVDLERYSQTQAGCSLTHLTHLHAMGLCSSETLMAVQPGAPATVNLPSDITTPLTP